jgi:hypothetical protein
MRTVLTSLLALALLVGCGGSGSGEVPELTGDELAKAIPSVILERARQGQTQDLYVVFEVEDIRDRANQRARERGLSFWDRALADGVAAEFALIKASVFPDGALGGAVVLEDSPHVPMLFARFPDERALSQVLRHPRVLWVMEPGPPIPPAAAQ